MTHVNWRMPLGGALRGILPNPTLLTEEASLVIAGRVFGTRVKDARELLSGTADVGFIKAFARFSSPLVDWSDSQHLETVRALLPHPSRIPKVQAGTNITIAENALGPVISASASSTPDDGDTVNAHRAFFPRAPVESPVNDAQAIAAQLAHQPHVPRAAKVQAGTNITIVENALGPVISAASASGLPVDDGDGINAHRAFFPRAGRPSPPADDSSFLEAARAFLGHPDRVPKVQAGTNVTIVENALGPVISAPSTSYSPGSFTVATENYYIMSNHLKLTTTQRATLAGTSRLRIT